jgi:hypothetical protein
MGKDSLEGLMSFRERIKNHVNDDNTDSSLARKYFQLHVHAICSNDAPNRRMK